MSLPIVIDNTSPLINYQPSKSDWIPWQDESGRSYVVTSVNDARLEFQFFGTGCTVYGRATKEYKITLDERVQDSLTPKDLALFSVDDLPSGSHHVSLISPSQAEASQELLAFQQVTIRHTDSADTAYYVDNKNASAFTYNGQWSLQTTKGVPNATVTSIYHTTSQLGANVSFTFAAATTILVRGMLDNNSGPYTADLDGESSSYTVNNSTLVADALIYYRGGLDPNASHTVILANNQDKKILAVTSITLYQDSHVLSLPPKTSPVNSNPATPKAAIVGGTIIAVLLVLGGLAYVGYRKRQTLLARWKLRKLPHMAEHITLTHHSTTSTANNARAVLHPKTTPLDKEQEHTEHLPSTPDVSGYSQITRSTHLGIFASPHDEESLPSTPSSSALFIPFRDLNNLTPPHSPISSITPSTQMHDFNGTRIMSWSRSGSTTLSETAETAHLIPANSRNSFSRADASTSTPPPRKPRPLPSIPFPESGGVEEERDAGLYNEGTLMRLLSAGPSSGVLRSDPSAPPPRYEARK